MIAHEWGIKVTRCGQGRLPATIDVVAAVVAVAVAVAVVVVGSEGGTDMILVPAASSDHCPDGSYFKL